MDLSTTYMGLELKNPIVASASPLSKNIDNYKRMEDAGIAAVVHHSLFGEEIIKEEKKAAKEAAVPKKAPVVQKEVPKKAKELSELEKLEAERRNYPAPLPVPYILEIGSNLSSRAKVAHQELSRTLRTWFPEGNDPSSGAEDPE